MFQNNREGLALALPAALFTAALFLLPVGILLSEAFKVDGQWSLQGYIDFASKPLNQIVFLRTLKLGFLVAFVSAIIGYACAFCIVNLDGKDRGRIFGLVVLPLLVWLIKPRFVQRNDLLIGESVDLSAYTVSGPESGSPGDVPLSSSQAEPA